MRKKLLIAFGILVVIVAGLAVYVALQPAEYRIVRTATINAPPADVFDLINDFHKWDAWSPWEKIDPAMTRKFEGPEAGTGAVYKWSGNSQAGEGMMTIQESKPNELIKIKLDFTRPFESTANTDFTLKPEGDKTLVTWTMQGQNNFLGKTFDVIFNMDKTVGGQFETGLASMKAAAEKGKK